MMTLRHRRARRRLASLIAAGCSCSLIAATPARALEEVVINLPLIETRFTLRLSELESAEALRRGNSDLAELDRATGGSASRQLLELMRLPVPLSIKQVAEGLVGAPMVEQAMLVLSSLGTVEGREADLSGRTLHQALLRAAAGGELTLLSLMRAIPGQRVTLDLGRAQQIAQRMARQRQEADALLAATLPAPTSLSSTPVSAAPHHPLTRRLLSLEVPHRDQPLELLLIEPVSGARGRLVLISHGLWDAPSSFEGWGTLLASHGYSVVLPRHPGSDSSQQQAILAGRASPPGPEELALRPKDLSAVLDALAQGRLALRTPVDSQRVVVLGHSWGGTTAMQMAGLRPTDSKLRQRCSDVEDGARNLSWTLQCSWLRGAVQAGLSDARVIAVAAISPPVSLLFPRQSASELNGRVLLVSGSRDWVVPPDPEAIDPMRWGRLVGNQLVLVRGGDHFNLRPEAAADGGVLGPLLLAWTEAAFKAGAAARPAPGAPPLLAPRAWNSTVLPMADVTSRLPNP